MVVMRPLDPGENSCIMEKKKVESALIQANYLNLTNYMDAIRFLLIISLPWLADLQFLAHLLNKPAAFPIAPLTDLLPYIMPINHILFEN
jgi:hypothetical protein